MKLKKKSTGEYFTLREFLQQWGEGIKKITPLQQCRTNQWGYLLMFIGIVWGIIISIQNKLYWLVAILFGTFIIQVGGFHSNWIRKKQLEMIEKEFENE